MALSNSEKGLIRLIQNLAKNELEMAGRIEQVDILAFGSPNMIAGITQAEIDEFFPDSGLTPSILGDAAFGLKLLVTGGTGAGMVNCKAALTIVANLPQ